jgi:hypothetical protein
LLGQDFVILLQAAVVRKECFLRVGLLDGHLSGLDDWDVTVRISELYPIVALKEPAVIYREATPFSGQGSSCPDSLCLKAIQHQRLLLALPRATAAPVRQREDARRRLIRRISGYLIWNAEAGLLEGSNRDARANILAALRINPVRAVHPGVSKLLLRTLLPPRQPRWNGRQMPLRPPSKQSGTSLE